MAGVLVNRHNSIHTSGSKPRGGVRVGRGGEELATCKVPCKLNITYLPCPSAVVEGRKNVLVINWW